MRVEAGPVEKLQRRRWWCVCLDDHLAPQTELLLQSSTTIFVSLRKCSTFRWRKPKLRQLPTGAVRQNASPPCHLNADQPVATATGCLHLYYNELTQREERGYVTEDDEARRPADLSQSFVKARGITNAWRRSIPCPCHISGAAPPRGRRQIARTEKKQVSCSTGLALMLQDRRELHSWWMINTPQMPPRFPPALERSLVAIDLPCASHCSWVSARLVLSSSSITPT